MNKPKKVSVKYTKMRSEIDQVRAETRSQRQKNKLLALASSHGTKGKT